MLRYVGIANKSIKKMRQRGYNVTALLSTPFYQHPKQPPVPLLQHCCLGKGVVGFWRGYFNRKRCRRREKVSKNSIQICLSFSIQLPLFVIICKIKYTNKSIRKISVVVEYDFYFIYIVPPILQPC